MLARTFLLAAIALCSALVPACPLSAADPPAEAATRKKDELAWAKGVASDFLDALRASDVKLAAILMAAELRKEIGSDFALDNWLVRIHNDGLTAPPKIAEESISPDTDEAAFRGTLHGEKKTADFSIRLVKEKENGKWRVIFFRYNERRP